jgi:hypothetical protein
MSPVLIGAEWSPKIVTCFSLQMFNLGGDTKKKRNLSSPNQRHRNGFTFVVSSVALPQLTAALLQATLHKQRF